jgi:hypothetical protein
MMEASSRRTRFQERVRIERDFLAPVNATCGSFAPLAGMTEAAIISWEERCAHSLPDLDAKQIAKVLREAALRAELLADRSKDVFAGEKATRPDGLEVLRVRLEGLLGTNDN